jgi:hypothetical protein
MCIFLFCFILGQRITINYSVEEQGEKAKVSDIWEVWHLDGLGVLDYHLLISYAWQGIGIGMESRIIKL